MTRKSSLVIDVTRVETSKRILPRPPILSSLRAGWENINFEYHLQPAFETPKHFTTNYALIIRMTDIFGLERKLDGRYKKENSAIGDFALIPPNVVHWAASSKQSEFLVLSLKPDFIIHNACELVNEEDVEILPQFSQPDALVYQMGLAVQKALQSNLLCSRLYVESIGVALSAHLLQNYSSKKYSIKEYTGGLPRAKLQRAIDFILNHLSDDLLLEAIAQEVGMSKYHFTRLFKQSTGLSPYQYVIQSRIEHAKMLLLDGNLKISEISAAVGFSDQSQFTRQFKRLVGVTPKEILVK